VKRQWDSEELVEHFTLLADESILLDNLSGSNRLGFALLLKFFQIEARFPISKQEIPKSVVSYIAKQVDVSPRAIKEYSFTVAAPRLNPHGNSVVIQTPFAIL
jgi:hypothetical protein